MDVHKEEINELRVAFRQRATRETVTRLEQEQKVCLIQNQKDPENFEEETHSNILIK